MANTYSLIASSIIGSGGAANIEFTSIPADYTDLIVLTSLRTNDEDTTVNVTVNNSTTSYTNKRLYGDGSSVASDSYSTSNASVTGAVPNIYTSNTFSNMSIYFPNYASSNYKSSSIDTVTENNATTSYAMFDANLWSNTAAITSIKLTSGTGNFVQYSTAYLYGIKNS